MPPKIADDVPDWLRLAWEYFGTLPGQGRSFYQAPIESPNQRVQAGFDALPPQDQDYARLNALGQRYRGR